MSRIHDLRAYKLKMREIAALEAFDYVRAARLHRLSCRAWRAGCRAMVANGEMGTICG